jgi:hypothetical protein
MNHSLSEIVIYNTGYLTAAIQNSSYIIKLWFWIAVMMHI